MVLKSNSNEHWAILHGVLYNDDGSKFLPHPHVSVTVANVRHNQEWACDWLGCGLCLGAPPVPTPVSLPESTVLHCIQVQQIRGRRQRVETKLKLY